MRRWNRHVKPSPPTPATSRRGGACRRHRWVSRIWKVPSKRWNGVWIWNHGPSLTKGCEAQSRRNLVALLRRQRSRSSFHRVGGENATAHTPDDKTLFEAASRIIKLGERENLTLDKAVGCVACSKPAHKRRKKDLASSLIEHQRKQSTQGQRNLQ
jgi:hypothetical protein